MTLVMAALDGIFAVIGPRASHSKGISGRANKQPGQANQAAA